MLTFDRAEGDATPRDSVGAKLRRGLARNRRGRGKPRVFVSYRRDDAEGHAHWVTDRLTSRFDVLLDVDSIPASSDFVEWIKSSVREADALVAVIGDEWLTIADENGRARLRDPADYVRLELETALESGIDLVPLLVEGASMPSPAELPEALAPLSKKQAIELSSTRRHYDVERLIAELDDIVADSRPPGPRLGRLVGIGAAVLALALAALAAVLLLRGDDGMSWNAVGHSTFTASGKQQMAAGLLDGSRFVAVGRSRDDAAVWVSPDGEAWATGSGLAKGGSQEMTAVASDGGALVAVGGDFSGSAADWWDAAVWRSTDGGESWEQLAAAELRARGLQRMNAVASTGSRLVAVGEAWTSGQADAAVWWSDDGGASWTRGESDEFGGPDNQVLQGVAYSAGLLVGVGHDNGAKEAAVWTSADDGTSWTRVAEDGLAEDGIEQLREVVRTDSGWIAVGWDAAAGNVPTDGAVWTSRDGVDWARVADDGLAAEGAQDLRSVAVGGPGLVAAGLDGEAAAAWTSGDGGRTWKRVGPLAEPGAVLGLARAADRIVAFGRSGATDAGVWIADGT